MTLQVTWVAGAAAAGKTTWIRDHIRTFTGTCGYCAYRAASQDSLTHKIDATYLSYVCPNIQILSTVPHITDLPTLENHFEQLFIEVDSDIDRSALPELPVDRVEHVLLQAENSPAVPGWVTQPVVGHRLADQDTQQNLSWNTLDLTGEILDPPSLAVVWTELTQGGYGKVQRAKALFETIEGYPLHFNFVAGCSQADYEELEIARNLKGRPKRFSGLAVLGPVHLTLLQQSLKDASLDDRLIEYYQAQINPMLAAPTSP